MKKQVEKAEVLLGRRIRALRTMKGWTQQELGNQADINYKFLGEIERGHQNPSFNTLMKLADALGVELAEMFRFEQEISDRNEIEDRIKNLIKNVPDDVLPQAFSMLRSLYPFR